ncbi:hypothetical protein DFQ27_003100 [Actinomortierella ambigua]|uniref:Uncharacterized protein n=1 Tax=Actinomortierella ambigua TaxID=1343610 RepID=A0A9P6U6C3_9FUNG|nr:hypothetical protein DFQ27_003100 [Actinomortierella ambigua]
MIGSDPVKILCTVDETGLFTMMSFDTGRRPSISRYFPATKVNATYTEAGRWRNVVIAVNYRWRMEDSYLFNVPRASTSNNQSAVYHVFSEERDLNTLSFGYLNPETGEMDNSPISWNLTSFTNSPQFTQFATGQKINLHASNDTVYAAGIPFPRDSGSSTMLLGLPFNVKNVTAPPQPKSDTAMNLTDSASSCVPNISSTLGDYYFGVCNSVMRMLVYDGKKLLQTMEYPWQTITHGVAMPGDASIVYGSSNSTNNTRIAAPYFLTVQDEDVTSGLTAQTLGRMSLNDLKSDIVFTTVPYRINITDDYDIRFVPRSTEPPPLGYSSSLDAVPVVAGVALLVLIVSVIGFCCWRRRRARSQAQRVGNLQKHRAEGHGSGDDDDATESRSINHDAQGVEVSQKLPEDDNDERQLLGKMESDEVRGNSAQGWTQAVHSQGEEEEAIPMSTMVGHSVASPSAPSLPDQGMSSSSRVPAAGGIRQRRQLIVLSSHPRPNMFTTIEQASNSEGEEEGEEQEESLAPPEEWIPKPFDPRGQTSLRPPHTLPANVSNTSLAQPTAPPATAEVMETNRHSVSGRTRDEDEPLPLYEDKSGDYRSHHV